MSIKYKVRDQHGLTFFTATTVGWVDVFSREIYRQMVLESWRYCQKQKGFQIHAYTIMSNHVHLIASCRSPFLLTDVMRDWKAFTARSIIDSLLDNTHPESRREWLLHLLKYFAGSNKSQQTYQFWQHDNHPVALYSDEVIDQKLQYIHNNAVRAGWVELPEHWLYSSAPDYANTREHPLLPVMNVWHWLAEHPLE